MLESNNPLSISIVGGGRLHCDSKCKNLTWEMAGHCFTTTVKVLALGGYDMVLGEDHSRKLDPLLFEFVEKH